VLDLRPWLRAGNALSGMPAYPKGHIDPEVQDRTIEEVAALLAEAPLVPRPGESPPGELGLFRPNDAAEWVAALDACCAHLPWRSPSEGQAHVQGRYRAHWVNGLILRDTDGLCGVLVVGPFANQVAVTQFGLAPSHRTPDRVTDTVAAAWDLIRERISLEWVLYDDTYRAAFESVGFVSLITRHRLEVPLVERPLRPGLEPKAMTRADVETFLRLSGRTLDCTLEHVLEDASFAAWVDGAMVGAIIVSDEPREDAATLEEVWLTGAQRHSGWATALGQSSINGVIRRGLHHYEAWEDVNNKTIQSMNARFGVSYKVPLRHYGRIQPETP
jgi:hypothetical protein